MKKRPTVNIGGIEAIVATPEECEAVSFVVCGSVSYFADDVHARCAYCDTPIVHRPYVPLTPPKICIACLLSIETKKRN